MNLSLLVATPQLTGSLFSHTAVLMLEQEESGALGLIVNRLAGQTLSEMAPELSSPSAKEQVFLGGPVETSGGWCLYRTPVGHTHEVQLAQNLWLSREMQVLEQLLSSGQEFRLFLGYAGWGAGQLEREMQEGAWLWGEVSAAEFEGLLWHTPMQDFWKQALTLMGLNITQLAGSARA